MASVVALPAKKVATVAKAELVPSTTVDRKLVEDSVQWINKRVGDTYDKAAHCLLEIGQHVFKTFFQEKPEQVRLRGRQKQTSFRALANHPQLRLSAAHLHNAIYLAIQEKQLIAASVQTFEHITMCHKLELIKVPNIEDKRRLLAEASAKQLSVRGLHDRIKQVAVKALPAASSNKGEGKLRIPGPIRALSALKLERTVSERKLQSLSAKQLQSYRDALESARKRLNEMIKAVDKARK